MNRGGHSSLWNDAHTLDSWTVREVQKQVRLVIMYVVEQVEVSEGGECRKERKEGKKGQAGRGIE